MPPDQPKSSLTVEDWAVVAVLAAINFTHMVDAVIIMPLGKRLMDEFQVGPDQFSYIIAVYGLCAGVGCLLASLVCDRFDRKHVLIGSYAGFLVATLLCGLASSYEQMLVARGLAGACGGLAAAAMMAVIGDRFRPDQRGTATGAVMSAFAVASVAGLPVGLLLAGRFNRGTPFEVLAGLGLGVLAAIVLVLPSFRGHLAAARRDVWTEFGIVATEPRHLVAFAFTISLVLGTFTVAAFLGPYFLASNPDWTEDHELAIVYLVAGLLTLVSMNVVGRLSDKLPRPAVFATMAGVSLAMCLVVTRVPVHTLPLAVGLLSAFMVFAVGRMVPAQAMLIGVPLARNRGAFMNLNTAVSNFAMGCAPVVGGVLLTKNAAGGLDGYETVGVVAAVAAGLSLVLSRFIRPVTATAAPEAGVSSVGAETVGAGV